jgi:hypothetical protein
MSKYRIAVIPGDGLGNEVIPEGIRVLETVGRRFGLSFSWDHFDWSCEYYNKHGRMMPEGGLDQIRKHDAIYLGAVGFPGVPDHVSLWGLLIPIRREFRQYVSLRPVRLLRGMTTPLAGRSAKDFDFYVVRENNEGEYSEVGGRLTAHPNIKGIFAVWGDPAMQAVAGARALGRNDVVITTNDLGPDTALYVARGEIHAIGAQLPYDLGVAEANAAAYALLGKPVPPYISLPALRVKKANLLSALELVTRQPVPDAVRAACAKACE